MNEPRGREARLRPEFDYLYPDIEAGAWQPVETLIHRVVTMLYGDRSRSGVITGERLLRDDHFEFRGVSPRPAGLPPELSRLSDRAHFDLPRSFAEVPAWLLRDYDPPLQPDGSPHHWFDAIIGSRVARRRHGPGEAAVGTRHQAWPVVPAPARIRQ